VGLNAAAAYDVASKKIFTELKIDPEGYTEELKQAAGKALGFAQKIVYICKDTVGYFLAKANAGAKALEKYSEAPAEEENKEKPAEEDKKEEESKEKEDTSSENDAKTEDTSSENDASPAELNKPEESA
jgi:hypothetical protein